MPLNAACSPLVGAPPWAHDCDPAWTTVYVGANDWTPADQQKLLPTPAILDIGLDIAVRAAQRRDRSCGSCNGSHAGQIAGLSSPSG